MNSFFLKLIVLAGFVATMAMSCPFSDGDNAGAGNTRRGQVGSTPSDPSAPTDPVHTECSNFEAASCKDAKPTSGKKCIVRLSGKCGNDVLPMVSEWYRDNENKPLTQKLPFVLPAKEKHAVKVPCLNRATHFFGKHHDVNQKFLDLAEPLDKDTFFYRWEERTFGLRRVKGVRDSGLHIIFTPLVPLTPLQSQADTLPLGGFANNLLPNGPGGKVYGWGLYTAGTPTSSFDYGKDTAKKKGEKEVFLLEIEVKAGTMLLDSSIPSVKTAMTAMELTDQDVYNCNPPVIYNIPMMGGWFVMKDPTAMEATEFTGTHIPAETLRNEISGWDYAADADSKTVVRYLKCRTQFLNWPGFSKASCNPSWLTH